MHPEVLHLIGELDGCSLWRNLLPVTELQRQGFQGIEWGMKDDEHLGRLVERFDAVVLPRLHWPSNERKQAENWFRALHIAGKTIIYEVDDDLMTDGFVSRLVNHHGYTREDAEDRRSCILNVLENCDGVTVSTQRIATIAREYTDKPVKVVGNYIDLRWFKRIQKQAERKVWGLTIGWAGGNRPDSDVEMMAKAWGRIAQRYPNVTFVIQGHHAKTFYENVPNERIAMLDWLPIDNYPIGLVNIDIGCCPLGDTPFNRSKSTIKAMEYAASGAAVVASPTVYNQIIQHGKDGFIAETTDEWEGYLSQLVESYELRREMGKALFHKVKTQYSLEDNAWRWITAWTEIVDDYRWRQSHHILLPNGVIFQPSKGVR